MRILRTGELYRALEKRILILDGAMGTMLQASRPEECDFRGDRYRNHPVPLKGDNDVLCLTKPDLVRSVHRQYLEAGADIIETNTFNANKVSQKEYGLENDVYAMARAAAEIASSEAAAFTARTPEKPRFTAGSIGPTSCTLSLSPDVSDPAARALSFEEMVQAYKPAVEGLLDGGADILLIETVFDTLNAKAAYCAAQEVFEARSRHLPVMFSGTVSDASGRLLSGQSAEAFLLSVAYGEDLLSVGFNCALGAAEMRPHIEAISALANCRISAHPNAGLPDEEGHYHQTPEGMARIIRSCAEDGLLNIVGGCCGTNPEFIAAIAKAVEGIPPRKVPVLPCKLRLAGLDPVIVSSALPFLNIGERANVAGSRKFLNLMKQGNIAEGLRICRSQVENGAQVLDINMDDAMLESGSVMRTFLRSLAAEPDIARVPVMIDSSRWNVIRTGLQNVQGKCIVNSISLKEGEEPFKAKAREARKYGAAILCMAFDEQGQADTVERRVSVCRRMYRILTEEIHMPPEDIIFDPNVFAVATGMPEHDSCARDFIEAVRLIKQEMPLCSVSGGISNVSFSFRGNEPVRRALHSVFLYHAVKAGLGMAIVNPAQLDIYDEIEPCLRQAAEAVILNTSPDAGEKLLAMAAGIKEDKSASADAPQIPAWRSGTLARRLAAALIHGDDTWLESDLAEALKEYDKAVSIIEGPLMDGMREAGRLFGEGKMFLPQVVKTARTMKCAVDYLAPYMNGESAGNSAGTVVLATVKGDVHDIGKNIVSVILRCNNYKVIDLGVMTPADKILETAEKEQADAVALSGLITPSLAEMERVASEMEKRHMKIPLFVGGATTSEEHTALHIQKHYSGLCIQTCDASQIVPAMNAALHPEKYPSFRKDLACRYEKICRAHSCAPAVSAECVTGSFKVQTPSPRPVETCVHTLAASCQDLYTVIDWNEFYRLWGLHGKQTGTEEVRLTLRSDAEKLLTQNRIRLRAVWGIFPVSAQDETVKVLSGDRRTTLETLTFPRSPKAAGHPSLADFLTEEDYMGMFALSAGYGVREESEKLREQGDEYHALLLPILAEVMAEAFARYLHRKIHTEFWHLPEDQKMGIRAAPGYPTCPDHALKRPLFRLLNAEKTLEIHLTENDMMDPAASICAFLFASPESFYF